ncbi:hypothetical protein [Spirillospora sp. NPDC029432]|uniref:hypothetical protein n=1 Tax=Spirillospora sp. NPDC029432 TaxID=3154599 RepID=UPI0034516BDB
MERRLLLLAALGLSAGAVASPGVSVRDLLTLALNSRARSVEDWELACDDHLHALRTRPPVQVRNDLMVDLLALQRQLHAAGEDDRDLQLVVAALSTLHAAALTRLGEHGSAIQWWRTAKAAADVSGDLELRLGIRATEAGHGLYGQRDAGTVLRLTQSAQQIAGRAPSTGMALVACSQAKALALLGRRGEARRVLNTYRDLAATAPAPKGVMPGYWNNGHLHFAENMVFAGVGDEKQASRASELVLASSNPDYQVSVQVRLHDALCTAVAGGIDQGARQAAEILDGLPGSYRSQMITETGRTVLRAVPADKRERPAVREFAEILVRSAPTS